MADPGPERPFDPVIDHRRQASELLADGFRLADEHLKYPVLNPLLEDEIVAPHLGCRLELAVDAPVALLDPAGIPRQVKMEEVRAMRLEVESLPGSVGRQEDAQGLPARRGVEPPLDFLAPVTGDQSVDHRDPVIGQVRALDRLGQHPAQPGLGAFPILGEDDDAAVIPAGCRSRRRGAAKGRQAGA